MSRFDMVEPAQAGNGLSGLYDEICGSGFGAGGRPINWFVAMGERPDLVATCWTLVRGLLVAEGQLPPTLKQMILMTISLQNRCRYCAVTHTGVLESMGVPEDVISACARDPRTANIPPPHREILAFCLKAARNANSITEADVEALREVGLSRGEIMEATLLAAFTHFINTWADVSGIDVDALPQTDTWGDIVGGDSPSQPAG